MRRKLLAALALTVAGCSTTTFQSTWRSPDTHPVQLRGQKVAAVFVTRDPILRRRAEDAMAREITMRGAEGVPSYTFLSDRDVRDRDIAKEKAESLGFSGAVVMRIVGTDTAYTHTPRGVVWIESPYRHLWGGYWGWGWATVWEPGYLARDRVVKIETLIYSLAQDQLIWASVSRTFDPGRIEDVIAELAKAVSDRMAHEGLLTQAQAAVHSMIAARV
ncbi:MAG TPA: hypothetical protein VKU62_02615 [Thermoanaerobaculia bacterium]|nr:hypothetical protein [Thermoanaerobaculia bacterium]